MIGVEFHAPRAGEEYADGYGLTWTRMRHEGEGWAQPRGWWETYALGYRVRVWFEPAAGGWVLEQLEHNGWRRLAVRDREHDCMALVGERLRTAGGK